MDYYAMFNAVKTKSGFLGTYEFIPELGKYYYNGHRNCKIVFTPEMSRASDNICPVCGKGLTIGTLGRTDTLSDRKALPSVQDFNYTMPLPEILSEIYEVGDSSKKIQHVYSKIISALCNEYELLHKIPLEDIRRRDPIL